MKELIQKLQRTENRRELFVKYTKDNIKAEMKQRMNMRHVYELIQQEAAMYAKEITKYRRCIYMQDTKVLNGEDTKRIKILKVQY